jgi:hypothetical protein
MAICNFCHREFANAQAVRAHLKSCDAYKASGSRQPSEATPLGNDLPSAGAYAGFQEPATAGFDPVRSIQRQLTTERLRLKLREIERAHAILDDEAASRRNHEAELAARRENRALSEKREQEALRRKEEAAARADLEAKTRHEQIQSKRRALIQEVKNEVIAGWGFGLLADSELKARILLEIEKALSPLPVQELPKAELIQIAEAARDRLYHGHRDLQKAQRRLAEQRQTLLQEAIAYAQRELRDIDGLGPLDRLSIETTVRERLASLSGDETRAEVIDRVEDILDEQGLGITDDEEE